MQGQQVSGKLQLNCTEEQICMLPGSKRQASMESLLAHTWARVCRRGLHQR